MSPMSPASCSRNRETACGNSARGTPRACTPRLWGISSQGCLPPPKFVGHLQLPWPFASLRPAQLLRAGSHPAACQGSVPPLGDCTPAAPQAWQGTHLSCINYIPFIFPSSWRDLGAESTAQTVSLASRERWHCDIREGRHAPPRTGQHRSPAWGQIRGTRDATGDSVWHRDRDRAWLFPPEQAHRGGAGVVL